MLKSSSQPTSGLGDFKDLRKKTEFTSLTVDGVNKNTTYCAHLSGIKSSPKFSLGDRRGCSFIRSSSVPAPGVYEAPEDDRNPKYKQNPKFSFGGQSRFGVAPSPAKRQPG